MSSVPGRNLRRIAFLAVALAQGGGVSPWGSPVAWAFEVDQFTRRDVRPARDAGGILDELVNREIDAAIADANNRLRRLGARCLPGSPASDERITSALAARLVGKNPVKSRIDAWLMGLPEGEFRLTTPAVDSIYNSPKYQLVVIGQMLAPEIELAGVRTGTDKAGHFFQIGHRLHRLKVARAGLEIPCSELEHVTSEEGYYGCGSGGFVYSYGDMAANVAGQSFWDRVFGSGTAAGGSYVVCGESGQFERGPNAGTFAIADYVSPLWDEAVNCSMDCDGRGGHRSSAGLSIQEVTGHFSCPFPEATVFSEGRFLSAPEYCAGLAVDVEGGGPFGNAAHFWGSSCASEVVSPACLRAGASRETIQWGLNNPEGILRYFSAEPMGGFAVSGSKEGAP